MQPGHREQDQGEELGATAALQGDQLPRRGETEQRHDEDGHPGERRKVVHNHHRQPDDGNVHRREIQVLRPVVEGVPLHHRGNGGGDERDRSDEAPLALRPIEEHGDQDDDQRTGEENDLGGDGEELGVLHQAPPPGVPPYCGTS